MSGSAISTLNITHAECTGENPPFGKLIFGTAKKGAIQEISQAIAKGKEYHAITLQSGQTIQSTANNSNSNNNLDKNIHDA